MINLRQYSNFHERRHYINFSLEIIQVLVSKWKSTSMNKKFVMRTLHSIKFVCVYALVSVNRFRLSYPSNQNFIFLTIIPSRILFLVWLHKSSRKCNIISVLFFIKNQTDLQQYIHSWGSMLYRSHYIT